MAIQPLQTTRATIIGIVRIRVVGMRKSKVGSESEPYKGRIRSKITAIGKKAIIGKKVAVAANDRPLNRLSCRKLERSGIPNSCPKPVHKLFSSTQIADREISDARQVFFFEAK